MKLAAKASPYDARLRIAATRFATLNSKSLARTFTAAPSRSNPTPRGAA
jgi:hypothetical protein